MDTQDTSPSVLLFFDKERFIFNAGEYESQLGSHPIASGFHEILIVSEVSLGTKSKYEKQSFAQIV
ncbi:hypothetical protein PRUPE_6G337500 [Prunus persica]|uniref:Uncharacterized protein n=1 Tax=Prunus persica TaxID=3760 RepID=A0A251NZG9_PRUPE|nr:hypothetical protein PRUPE_6G337500 [Prunus persica]